MCCSSSISELWMLESPFVAFSDGQKTLTCKDTSIWTVCSHSIRREACSCLSYENHFILQCYYIGLIMIVQCAVFQYANMHLMCVRIVRLNIFHSIGCTWHHTDNIAHTLMHTCVHAHHYTHMHQKLSHMC